MIYDMGGVHTLRLLEMRILKAFHEMKLFFFQEFVGARRALIFMTPNGKRREEVFAVELRSICAFIVSKKE